MDAIEEGIVSSLRQLDNDNQVLVDRVIQAAREISGSAEIVAQEATQVGATADNKTVYQNSEGDYYAVDSSGNVYAAEKTEDGYSSGQTAIGTGASYKDDRLTFNSTGDYDGPNQAGELEWQRQSAILTGTGGVALLEYVKDKIQAAVSNVSSVGQTQITARKQVERKMSSLG